VKTVWDNFWKEKGKSMEWSQKDVLYSEGMSELSNKILNHLNKDTLKEVSLLELGAGMGITSLFFGYKGADVTLLDMSKEAKPLAKEYWRKHAKHNYIIADLFTFKSKEKYDIGVT